MSPSSGFPTVETLQAGEESSLIFPLDSVPGVDRTRLARRPWTTKILLENLLRHFDPKLIDPAILRALASGEIPSSGFEFPFWPGRILLQDFTGIPVLVDLTAMRSAAERHGIRPERVNPRVPVDLVVDHSVQVDSFGSTRSQLINLDREYDRNSERYRLLRWAQRAFSNLRIVPPGNGIVHQVNLEYFADVVSRTSSDGVGTAYPDTLLGTDSHTPMVNGLGVLGWGVGGIEAEAAMLGEPTFLGRPIVVGVRLTGELPPGSTATDLVLTVTRELRRHDVVEKFVEYFGPGLAHLSVPDRATISNMSPEYGATSGLFPVDAATLAYLRETARSPVTIARVEAYARRQGLWADASTPEPEYDEILEIDLGKVVPTVSGPKNPEEGVPLAEAPASFRQALNEYRRGHPARPSPNGHASVRDGSVVIAAITSCTNTSNPTVMVGAGLIAQRARALGMRVPPHVKTSLAPGSKVVTEYLARAGLMKPLQELGFDVVGYGCTTCIGNSGPLPPEIDRAVRERDAYVVSVLSGNRNFEARIHNLVRANYLASPMLVVAYALAGRMDVDITREPIALDASGRGVSLADLWPTPREIRSVIEQTLDPEIFREKYREITVGDVHWESLDVPEGPEYPWDARSTYLREPPYFRTRSRPVAEKGTLVEGARALVFLGDGVSTDHISPAGEIAPQSPAARYLERNGVPVREFNTYGSRRGNHEVMIRGTFANVRLKNALIPGKEGGWTIHLPDGEPMTVYDAAEKYHTEGVPQVVLAGAHYGQGSSRDWAAKGPALLGVRAVLAQSFERIHRANLVMMGVLPLQFRSGESAHSLGLTGREEFSLSLPPGQTLAPREPVHVTANSPGAASKRFVTRSRIDSLIDLDYYRHGGILPYVLERVSRDPGAPPIP